MKKIVLFFLIGLHCHITYAQLPQSEVLGEKLALTFNKNIELLGFAYFLAFEGVGIENKKASIDGKEILKKEWHKYGFRFYQEYKSFADNKYLVQSLSVTQHLWLDYIINFLLQVENVPNAKLTAHIPEKYYRGFSQEENLIEAKQNAEIFLDGLNKFYVEVGFEQYLEKSAPFYQAVMTQIKQTLPNTEFIKYMEDFYRQKFDSYTLVPSLTIPKGMGFGPRYTIDGKTYIYNVFGSNDYQKIEDLNHLDMGFGNEAKLRELSVHEFGHSFVNPIIYQLKSSIIDSSAYLFEAIQTNMSEQGYNTWKVCLIEHFVRAGEVVIAQKMGNQKTVKTLKIEYIQQRKFIYLPLIIKHLIHYDKHKNYSYEVLVHRVMKDLP